MEMVCNINNFKQEKGNAIAPIHLAKSEIISLVDYNKAPLGNMPHIAPK